MNVSSSQAPDSASELAACNELLAAGAVAEALARLSAALDRDPKNTGILGTLAWARYRSGDFGEARALYERLVAVDPKAPDPVLLLASIRFRDALARGERAFAPHYRGASVARASRTAIAPAIEDAVNAVPDAVALALVRDAAARFPEDKEIADAYQAVRRRYGNPGLRRLFLAFGGPRIARWLAGKRVFREAMLGELGETEGSFRTALERFYREGSANAVFPQSPPELRPETFAEHFPKCECRWWRWMRESLPAAEGKTILDIGCGPGFIGHHFAAAGCTVTGLTGAEPEIEECRRRGFRILQCDMHAIPVPAGTFDYVLASHVLEHSIAPFVMLEEIRRILKPGGLLFVNLPHPIDAEPRRDHPECYEAETDEYHFAANLRSEAVHPHLTYYSYGFRPHVFVLTYWQWRWAFRQARFTHMRSAIDHPDRGVLEPTDELLKELRDRPHHANQLFVLRKER